MFECVSDGEIKHSNQTITSLGLAPFFLLCPQFKMAVLVALLLILAFAVAAVVRRRSSPSPTPIIHPDSKPVKYESENGTPRTATPEPKPDDIEPLPDFDWQATPPLQLRPFKPTYNITMGVFIHQYSTKE